MADTFAELTFCTAHPQVETELRCSRCGTPICPRCLVYTPVGARCRACARIRRLPTYRISPQTYLRAIGSAVATGAAVGTVWSFLIPLTTGFFFGILAGLLLGYAVAETTDWATNRKRGAPLQAIAVAGVVVAYLVRNLLLGVFPLPAGDLFGYTVVLIGIAFAISRLR